MKNVVAFALFFLAISILGCQDAKDESSSALTDLSSFKKIGHEIPYETGMRWIETYNKQNNIQGRSILFPYSVSESALAESLGSVDELVGVVFHHATDNSGVHHFIIIPIEESLTVWSEAPADRVLLDANTGEVISTSTAQQWTGNYKTQHPNDIWFHFFGNNIFDEILDLSGFDTLNIIPALSDLDLSPQLLLILTNDGLLFNGRTKGDKPPVYDASSPCPPCPVN